MIEIGDLVIVNEVASIYSESTSPGSKFGVVISVESARSSFNLDTDDMLCEVLTHPGEVCLVWYEDLIKANHSK